MDKEIKTGGPAFPETYMAHKKDDKYAAPVFEHGMTLRDYFAAKALQGILPGELLNGAGAAEAAYEYADAMLVEREKQTGNGKQ